MAAWGQWMRDHATDIVDPGGRSVSQDTAARLFDTTRTSASFQATVST
jgi:hypothetical protein